MSDANHEPSSFTHVLNSGNATFEFNPPTVPEHPFDFSGTSTSAADPITTTAVNGGTADTLASGVIHGSEAGAGRRVEGEEVAAAQPFGAFASATFASGVTDETVVVTDSLSNPFAQSANSKAAAALRLPSPAQSFGAFAPALSLANNTLHLSVHAGHSTSNEAAAPTNNVVSHRRLYCCCLAAHCCLDLLLARVVLSRVTRRFL